MAENRVGKTTLHEFMDALVGARLVLCNDSGAMHVASALGVPTMTVFGSTEPQPHRSDGATRAGVAASRPMQSLFPARLPARFRLHERHHGGCGHRGGGSFAEMKISACIITLNEERNLPRCLKSVAPLVDEILIVDSGSTDSTRDIAQEYGARVVHQDWLGYVGAEKFRAGTGAPFVGVEHRCRRGDFARTGGGDCGHPAESGGRSSRRPRTVTRSRASCFITAAGFVMAIGTRTGWCVFSPDGGPLHRRACAREA